jgi:hypothetical protein
MTTGAGTWPAGNTPAGLDGQPAITVVVKTPPPALAWNVETKDYIETADGDHKAAHPVDAKVLLILMTVAGSMRSAPGIGTDLARSRYINVGKEQRRVDDIIATRLGDMVKAREISLLGNEVDTSVRGRLVVRVNYRNMLTGRLETPSINV